MTTTEKIAALQKLGKLSDQINALNKRCNAAADRCGRIYRKSGRPGLANAFERWQMVRRELQTAYERSIEFSDLNGITRLPLPTGLEQRGSR